MSRAADLTAVVAACTMDEPKARLGLRCLRAKCPHAHRRFRTIRRHTERLIRAAVSSGEAAKPHRSAGRGRLRGIYAPAVFALWMIADSRTVTNLPVDEMPSRAWPDPRVISCDI
jgi:hypothetical protein